MTGHQFTKYRKRSRLTQVQAARALAISQSYLSLLEKGERPLTDRLKNKAARVFRLAPTEVPLKIALADVPAGSDDQLAAELAALGYKGFSHLRPSRPKNPAEVLLSTLNSPKRDARLVEALPWVLFQYPDLPWNELVKAAKVNDLQNRLGYITNIARQVAEFRGDSEKAEKLRQHESDLERSLLAREETLCNETMTTAERRWLAARRPKEARRWHLLTDLTPQAVNYYV